MPCCAGFQSSGSPLPSTGPLLIRTCAPHSSCLLSSGPMRTPGFLSVRPSLDPTAGPHGVWVGLRPSLLFCFLLLVQLGDQVTRSSPLSKAVLPNLLSTSCPCSLSWMRGALRDSLGASGCLAWPQICTVPCRTAELRPRPLLTCPRRSSAVIWKHVNSLVLSPPGPFPSDSYALASECVLPCIPRSPLQTGLGLSSTPWTLP